MNGEEGIRVPIGYKDIPSYTMFACEPPGVLFHYTDYEGARGIIESKSLWLTKFSYLNDKSELKLAFDLFRNRVSRVIDSFDDEKKDYVKEATDLLESLENVNICVASFCEDGDLLSQWRSYSNGGSGIALAFDSKALKALSHTGIMNLWKCVYSTKSHIIIVDDLIKILTNSYDLLKSTRQSGSGWERIKDELINYFHATFLRVAPVIKNQHFKEEQEWRIVTVTRSITDSNWFSRITNSRVFQYYRLDFDLLDDGETLPLVFLQDGRWGLPWDLCR